MYAWLPSSLLGFWLGALRLKLLAVTAYSLVFAYVCFGARSRDRAPQLYLQQLAAQQVAARHRQVVARPRQVAARPQQAAARPRQAALQPRRATARRRAGSLAH